MSNTIFMKGELITLSGNGATPKSFRYRSNVGEIGEHIAESWFGNPASGARNTSLQLHSEVAVCMSVLKNVSFLSLPYKGHYNQILYAKTGD